MTVQQNCDICHQLGQKFIYTSLSSATSTDLLTGRGGRVLSSQSSAFGRYLQTGTEHVAEEHQALLHRLEEYNSTKQAYTDFFHCTAYSRVLPCLWIYFSLNLNFFYLIVLNLLNSLKFITSVHLPSQPASAVLLSSTVLFLRSAPPLALPRGSLFCLFP